MKKRILLMVFGVLLTSIGFVVAIPNPAPIYCENMGYTYNNTHCIFTNGNICPLWDFHNGDCGQEYVKDLSCVELGGSLEPGYECCEGLISISISEFISPGICSMIAGAWPICAPCGDGVCDKTLENDCNCAEDCKISNVTQGNGNSKNGKDEEDGEEKKEYKTSKKYKLEETIRNYLNSTECPENCVCVGNTIKCKTENGREMTIVSGKSGNIIILTKGVNATATIVLIKNSTGIFGEFKGKIKRIRYTPDQIRERVLKRLKMRNCTNCSIELTEEGYEMNVERYSRILWIFRKKMQVQIQIDAENGEIIRIKKPWWAFLASEPKEEVGE